MNISFDAFKRLYEKYEHHLAAAGLVAGFLWDTFLFNRVDLWTDMLILSAYLLLAVSAIILLNTHTVGRLTHRAFQSYAPFFLPLFMQFAFGGLFSGFFIFYSRSGSLLTSIPFLAFLAALVVGNEFFRKRYQRFIFHMNVFFIALFSYAAFFVPVILGKMGSNIFLVSGLASITVMGGVIAVLLKTAPARLRENPRMLLGSIAGLYLLFNAFYFANIIPPVPLSLKEVGVYHLVVRTSEGYAVEFEPAPQNRFWNLTPQAFQRAGNAPIYVFSAVFAPTKLSTKIFHRWAYYEETKGEWITTDLLGFPIEGGRDGGYRGFTMKRNIAEGKWRVDVVTEQEQLLGRIKFRVVDVVEPSKLDTMIR